MFVLCGNSSKIAFTVGREAFLRKARNRDSEL